jgi:hypothetical protein
MQMQQMQRDQLPMLQDSNGSGGAAAPRWRGSTSSTPELNMLYDAIVESIQPILQLETELAVDKLQNKIYQYFQRAGKSAAELGSTWQEIVRGYADKVFDSLWAALGDREWLDKVDFTFCIFAGLQAYCQEQLAAANVPEQSSEEYMQVVARDVEDAFDSCRYYVYSDPIYKSTVNGPKAIKKVQQTVDAAREAVVKQDQCTPDEFISNWVSLAAKKLSESGSLPKEVAVRLFTALIKEAGGVPRKLVDGSGGLVIDAIAAEIQEHVSTVYAQSPDMSGGSGWGGRGGGKKWFDWGASKNMSGGWQDWSGGGYGKSPGEMPGDWQCPNCGADNWGKNKECIMCGTPKAASAIGRKPANGFGQNMFASATENTAAGAAPY